MPTRRAVVAGLCALPALAVVRSFAAPMPEPRPFRQYFPTIQFRYSARYCVDPIINGSDWRYQSLAETDDDCRGVIQHLPSGFAYYTFPPPGVARGSATFAHSALRLFAKGESMSDRFDRRAQIGRAAAWLSTLIEGSETGAFYIPRGYLDMEGPLERPAPPFIAGKIPVGFLLHA